MHRYRKAFECRHALLAFEKIQIFYSRTNFFVLNCNNEVSSFLRPDTIDWIIILLIDTGDLDLSLDNNSTDLRLYINCYTVDANNPDKRRIV